MGTKTDISFHRGEDITLRVSVIHLDDEGAEVATVITGWALAFAVARSYGETAIITKTFGSGITITNGAGGIFEVTIEDLDTDSLPTGGYVWDAKRTDAGQEAVLAYGNLNLKPNVAA